MKIFIVSAVALALVPPLAVPYVQKYVDSVKAAAEQKKVVTAAPAAELPGDCMRRQMVAIEQNMQAQGDAWARALEQTPRMYADRMIERMITIKQSNFQQAIIMAKAYCGA